MEYSKGVSALANLGDGDGNKNLIKTQVGQHISFRKKSGVEGYPISLMGAIALIRQTFYDVDWYKKATDASRKKPSLGRPEESESLASLSSAASRRMPVIFEAEDELMVLRIEKIVKEFKLNPIILGSGSEFKRLDAVKLTGIPLILPLNFPDAPDVKTPEKALEVSLEDLKEWDLAPSNPSMLKRAGVKFALTTYGMKKIDDFPKQLRMAMSRGLSKGSALAALTTIPANLFGVSDKLGTLEKGKMANLLITDGDLFSKKGVIKEVWIDGVKYEVDKDPEADPVGTWTGTMTVEGMDSREMTLKLKGSAEKLSGSVTIAEKKMKLNSPVISSFRIAFSFPADSMYIPGIVMMSGKLSEKGIMGDGSAPGNKKIT